MLCCRLPAHGRVQREEENGEPKHDIKAPVSIHSTIVYDTSTHLAGIPQLEVPPLLFLAMECNLFKWQEEHTGDKLGQKDVQGAV